jgi:uncharacterized protein (PEP-CTERM system associated)
MTMLAAMLLPPRAHGADWLFVPSLRWGERYSDNINLAPAPQAQNELVSEIAPGIGIAASSRRLNLRLDYTLEKRVYRRLPGTLTRNMLGKADAILLDDWFYADAHASLSRQNVSPFGAQLADPASTGGNTSVVKTSGVAPSIRHRFPGLVSIDAQYDVERVSTNNDVYGTRSANAVLRLSGVRGAGNWSWDAYTSRRREDDPALPAVHLESSAATLRYAVTPRLAVALSTGYDSNDYPAIAGAPQGHSWNSALSWDPSARTSMMISAGHRFYGRSYGLDLNHRARRSVWRLWYGEEITSTRLPYATLSQNDAESTLDQLWRVAIPDPAARRQQIEQFLRGAQSLGPGLGGANYFSHAYYLQKLLNASLALGGAHSTLLFRLSGNVRTAQTPTTLDNAIVGPGPANLLDKTRERDADLLWDWQLSPRSGVNLAATDSRIESVYAGRTDTNVVLKAGMRRQFQRKVSGTVELRRVRHGSSAGGAYRENALGATLDLQM